MPDEPSLPPYSAVVLAGGTGSRMGGADKTAIMLGGRTLLDRAVSAVVDAAEVVVVGGVEPGRTSDRDVTIVREEPALGGPGAALLTGRAACASDVSTLVVLACDMPHVTVDTVHRLREAATCCDGAALIGPDGRRQLALALDVAGLDRVTPAPSAWSGLSVWRLLSGLDLAAVPTAGQEHRDVDTWDDLRAMEHRPPG